MTEKERKIFDKGILVGLRAAKKLDDCEPTYIRGYVHGSFNAGQKFGVFLADVDIKNLDRTLNPSLIDIFHREAEANFERLSTEEL